MNAVPIEAHGETSKDNRMIRKAAFACFALLASAGSVSASSVEITCKIAGPEAAQYGPLMLRVDLAARTVRIEAQNVRDLVVWAYRDGTVASLAADGIRKMTDMYLPVQQFVTLSARWISVGWGFSRAKPSHIAMFNRSAIDKPGTPCVWRARRGQATLP
jgi:hypothetical protein